MSSGRYLFDRRARIAYIGWLDHHNLGDEAVYEATKQCFGRPFAHRPDILPEWLARLGRHDGLVLGGGTLIGGRFLSMVQSAPLSRQVVFGTGVIDPRYPHSYPEGTEVLDGWASHLRGVEHVGVRGPRSAEILEELGVHAEVIGDPIAQFAVDRPLGDPDGPVAVNVGHSFGKMWGSEYRALAGMVDTVSQLRARGTSVEYVVVWPGDMATTRQVAAQSGTGDAPVHAIYDRGTDFVQLASRWQAIVALKLHAAALGVCCGLPTVALEYHPKCQDFMSSVGLGDQVVRTDALEPDVVLDRMDSSASSDSSSSALAALAELAGRQRLLADQVLDSWRLG